MPELVTTSKEQTKVDAQGKATIEELKAIKYTALIPILTKAIQEQQAQIEELKKEINKLSNSPMVVSTKPESINSSPVYLSTITVDQNIPNPFKNTTTINYTLPSEKSNCLHKKVTAYIIITDKSDKTIKQINVSGSGKSSLSVDGSILSSGVYSYSLYIGGKSIIQNRWYFGNNMIYYQTSLFF